MVKHKREHSANFLPFKFRRTKPAIGAEHRRRTDPNILSTRRLTQVGFNTGSSNILRHPVDPELVYFELKKFLIDYWGNI